MKGHGITYSGHPVACAVALPNIRIIEEEGLPANAAAGGAYLLSELERLLERPYVGNVRGKGLMLLVEVVADKGTKAKFDPARDVGGKLTAATRQRGIVVRCTNDGIAIAPPLTIQRPELDLLAGATADAPTEVLNSWSATTDVPREGTTHASPHQPSPIPRTPCGGHQATAPFARPLYTCPIRPPRRTQPTDG